MINKAILIGNLGADPEVRHTQNGTQLAQDDTTPFTPEEVVKNKRRMGILMDQVLGRITESEARKRMQREMSGAAL